MTYYKATQPDGTSFHDGTTMWEVGRTTYLDGNHGTILCKAGVLHASTEPGEVLVGGSWPCRLFEVEPQTELVTGNEHPHKVGAYAWKVVRELPAHLAFGPNGEAVAVLIERVKTITPDQADRLSTARDAARGAAWNAARNAAWNAAWDAAWNAAWDAAWDAAKDAALALLVRDLISPEQFDILYGPWASIMGETEITTTKTPVTTENTEAALQEALNNGRYIYTSAATFAAILANNPAVLAAMRADGIIEDEEYVATGCMTSWCKQHQMARVKCPIGSHSHDTFTAATFVKASDTTPPPPVFNPGDQVRHFDGWIGWVVPWPSDREYFPRQQPVAVVPEGDRSVLCVDNADLTHLTGEEGS